MKCPRCGAWNQAYLPKCGRCGAPLEENQTQKQASWEEAMHKKKPSLQIYSYDDGSDTETPAEPDIYDPERLDKAELTDELEELKARRAAKA